MYKLKCDNINDLEEKLRINEEKLTMYETKNKDLSEKTLSLERLLADKEKLCGELEVCWKFYFIIYIFMCIYIYFQYL